MHGNTRNQECLTALVNISTISQRHDKNKKLIIVDFVDNAIGPDPDPPRRSA